MGFKFPYTNLHELNLDWILEQVKKFSELIPPMETATEEVAALTEDVRQAVEDASQAVEDATAAIETAEEAKQIAEQAAQGTIADGAVTTVKIADGAVTGAKIENNTIDGYKITAGAIAAGNLADGAVITAKLADGAVTTAKIADDAVTAAKIDDGAVGSAALASAAVTNAKIADGAVTNVKLASESVARSNFTSALETEFSHAMQVYNDCSTIVEDMNNLPTGRAVFCRWSSNTTLHAPTTSSGFSGIALCYAASSNNQVQFAIMSAQDRLYIRSCSGGSWSAWKYTTLT